MLTEQQNQTSMQIGRLATEEILTVINQQDARVPVVVAKTIP